MSSKEKDFSILNCCLLDFKTLRTSTCNDYILLLIDSLNKGESVALEHSGVYIDSDPDGTPEEFIENNGITFEFMNESLNVSKSLAVKLITDWCKQNIKTEKNRIYDALEKLKKLIQSRPLSICFNKSLAIKLYA
ncbi:hypothetical protein MHL40_20545 [Pseudomonas luteola]|uniref:hypothetical protein n=1 Tax=Pseudomonas luteola TaxID=47886 RepID=UPI001EF69047|nr:hypothetical protein [Pseudomonas luteola]MCG7375044.1 hypothetical protein [Pseudomonas luteola]